MIGVSLSLLLLVAQTQSTIQPHDTYGWVGPIVQLVTAGGFGALVWYLIVKHIPAIEKRHADDRTSWRESLAEKDRAMDKRDEEFLALIREFIAVTTRVETLLTKLEKSDA